MVARVVPVEDFDLVVFGATGDLARRKLIPSMYHRLQDGQMPDSARLIGAARSDMTADDFRRFATEALDQFVSASDRDEDCDRRFLQALDYVRVDATQDDGWPVLCDRLGGDPDRVHAFYLSVAPRFFGPIAERYSFDALVRKLDEE